MNVAQRPSLIPVGWKLDYSRWKLPFGTSTPGKLDETSLDEPVGLGGPPDRRTVFGVGGSVRGAPVNGTIDWNGNGVLEPPPVTADVNFFGIFPGDCAASPAQELAGVDNEWDELKYDFLSYVGGTSGDMGPRPSSEVTIPEVVDAGRRTDFDRDGDVNASDTCPGLRNATQIDRDGDGLGDACDPDFVHLCAGRAPTRLGTGRSDELRGTSDDDVIIGLGGADAIDGGGGDDIICGSAGGDRIRGSDGTDAIRSGRGPDSIRAGRGRDSLAGGTESDRLWGARGADQMDGGLGQDTANGGNGADMCTNIERVRNCP